MRHFVAIKACAIVVTLWASLVGCDGTSLQLTSSNPGPAVHIGSTCEEWVSWMPPSSDPAVVMQAVNSGFVDTQRNFIRLMERNSELTRHHLFLICMDDESLEFFSSSMGIRCVPWSHSEAPGRSGIWMLRVRAVSCLVEAGIDVIMSDADALWLSDPMKVFNLPSVRESSIVSSRGRMPKPLMREWGSTMCMGFILFRANPKRAMNHFLETMYESSLETGDDQVAVNEAADELGIVWRDDSDMSYSRSTETAFGTISNLTESGSESITIALLPPTKVMRFCHSSLDGVTVAHCLARRSVGSKNAWIQDRGYWSVGDDP